QPLHLTLESLPNENLFRILSHINPIDRVRVRKCSQRMKSAIEQCDLITNEIAIHFHSDGDLVIFFGEYNGCLRMKADYTESHSLKELTQRQSGLFRRARTDELAINFHDHIVDDEILEQAIRPINFISLKIHCHKMMQQCAINMIRRCEGKQLSMNLCCFRPDLQMIIDLPPMDNLVIQSAEIPIEERFEEHQILQIISKNHANLVLPLKCYVPKSATILRILQAAQSNEKVNSFSLHVAYINFTREFMQSMNLEEEGLSHFR
ncbi:hypothetical protein PFISCL1PPCAC_25144, partial [Pristionchus fissidentatus]